MFAEKRYLLTAKIYNSINLDKQFLLLIKQKQNKKIKKTKTYLNENNGWITGVTKVHVLTYFQNFYLLTNSSIIFEWMLHHTIGQNCFYTLISYTLPTLQYLLTILNVFHFTNRCVRQFLLKNYFTEWHFQLLKDKILFH